jgi:nucleoside-diphosphate-sugar epimerase
MKVLVAGASGFIGSRIVSALRADGHEVRCASRRRPAGIGCHDWVELDYTHPPVTAALRAAVADCEVVINAVGILREDRSQTFDDLHDRGPRALFDACAAQGVRRIIQLSALGSAADAPARYHRSKYQADRHLMDTAKDWVVLRPSLVYGGGGASARLFDLLASLPVTLLPAGGRQAVQPVHVDDLVAAVMRAVASPAAQRCVLDVVGPEPLTLREFLAALRAAMGKPRGREIRVPRWLVSTAARVGNRLPDALLDSETWGMLERGNTADATGLRQWLGREPRPVSEFIAPGEASRRRAEAALNWLLPLLRVSVASMWFIAAVVSAGLYPVADSLGLLRSIGVADPLAPVVLGGAVFLDFALGVLTLWPRRPTWLWSAQIVLVLVYTAIITWKLPALWLEPFGPVAKNLPILALLLLLQQLDRRK